MNEHEAYWKLSEMEERYNSSSASIRTLASAWLLAAFGAVGWLLDPGKQAILGLSRGLLAVFVCTVACTGIATLWVMDQLVFYRLLTSSSW